MNRGLQEARTAIQIALALHSVQAATVATPRKSDDRDLQGASVIKGRCTCPSGDGSLAWPCPIHQPDVNTTGEVTS